MIPQAMDKDSSIPEVITFELKKGTSFRQKITTKNGTARRASLPTLPVEMLLVDQTMSYINYELVIEWFWQ